MSRFTQGRVKLVGIVIGGRFLSVMTPGWSKEVGFGIRRIRAVRCRQFQSKIGLSKSGW